MKPDMEWTQIGRERHGKTNSPVRAATRAFGTSGIKSHARIGSGAKLRRTDAQKAVEFRMAQRRELRKIKLANLLEQCSELKFVAAVPGIRNVWQLSQTTSGALLAVPGLGPARLKKIHDYLAGRGVPVVWTP